MAGFWSLLLVFSLLLRQQKTRVTNLSSLAIHNSREEECTHYKHFINKRAHGNKIKILRSRTPQRQKTRRSSCSRNRNSSSVKNPNDKLHFPHRHRNIEQNDMEPPLPPPPLRICMLLIRDSTSRAIIMDYCCVAFFFSWNKYRIARTCKRNRFRWTKKTVTMHNGAITSLEWMSERQKNVRTAVWKR
jgi:hypothetical protein